MIVQPKRPQSLVTRLPQNQIRDLNQIYQYWCYRVHCQSQMHYVHIVWKDSSDLFLKIPFRLRDVDGTKSAGKTLQNKVGRDARWLKTTYFGNWRFAMQLHKFLARNDPQQKINEPPYTVNINVLHTYLNQKCPAVFRGSHCNVLDYMGPMISQHWKIDMGITSEISQEFEMT